MKCFGADYLREVGIRIFKACGATADEARIVADELLEANLMGLDSHGVMRYVQYAEQVRCGKIRPGAPITIIKETPTTAIVDCGFNFGAVSARRMVDVVCTKAESSHLACVVSQNGNHVGRLGSYAQKVAQRKLICIATANSSRHGHWVVPWGGREGRLATNPLAFAAPTGGNPVVLDMSTAMVSEGKIRHLMQKDESLPVGCIQDAFGNPTTDPKAFYGPPRGTIMPFGHELGYKGFGLSLMVEILGGVLAGNESCVDNPYINGLCLLAIDPEAFCGSERFAQLVDSLSEYIATTPPAPGCEEVFLPGELDYRTRKKRLVDGIPIPEETWAAIVETAEMVGAQIPEQESRFPTVLVDAHAHVFREIQGRIGTGITRGRPYGRVAVGNDEIQALPPLAETTSFTYEKLIAHLDWAGVDQAVLLQGSFYGECNDYIIEAVTQYPDRFIGAGYIDPWAAEARRTSHEVLGSPVFRAVKIEFSEATGLAGIYPQARLDDPAIDWLCKELQSRGKVLVLDLGAVGSRSYQTEAVRSIAEQNAGLKVVIAHLGQPTPEVEADVDLWRLWKSQIALGHLANVWFDSAALPAYVTHESYPYPTTGHYFRMAIELIGAGKVMWGSDIPGLLVHGTYRQIVEIARLHTAFLSDEEQKKILSGNAACVYGHQDHYQPDENRALASVETLQTTQSGRSEKRMKEKTIRVAIAGVGNCAQAFLEGIEYYRQHRDDHRGLMNIEIGGYRVTDIEPVAAFDINAAKVGRDLSEAIYAKPNNAYRYPGIQARPYGVEIQMGPILDGNPPHLQKFVPPAQQDPCDVARALRDSGAEMLLNFIPTESHQAAQFYADAAIKEAKIGFVNGMPTLIVCDPEYQQAAIENRVPLIGDDVKSQFGGTIIHRALATLMYDRGIHLDETYQINYAGNTDFANLMARGKSKHKTKAEAVTSLMPYPVTMSTGFTHIPLMKDRKTAVFYINGSNFGNAPLHFEAKLEVEDSANFAGVMVDIVRYMRLALDRGISGVLESACAFLTKHPPAQIPDKLALDHLKEYVAGTRER